jgi:hypothetical protein
VGDRFMLLCKDSNFKFKKLRGISSLSRRGIGEHEIEKMLPAFKPEVAGQR